MLAGRGARARPALLAGGRAGRVAASSACAPWATGPGSVSWASDRRSCASGRRRWPSTMQASAADTRSGAERWRVAQSARSRSRRAAPSRTSFARRSLGSFPDSGALRSTTSSSAAYTSASADDTSAVCYGRRAGESRRSRRDGVHRTIARPCARGTCRCCRRVSQGRRGEGRQRPLGRRGRDGPGRDPQRVRRRRRRLLPRALARVRRTSTRSTVVRPRPSRPPQRTRVSRRSSSSAASATTHPTSRHTSEVARRRRRCSSRAPSR